MDEFTTLYRSNNPSELLVVQSLLESEGIRCFVMDGLSTQMSLAYGNAMGGAKLRVRTCDAEATIEILRDAGYLHDEKPEQPDWFASLLMKTAALFSPKKKR